MSQSRCALGLLGLAFVGVWYAAGGARTPPVSASETVSAPVAHENLCVYLVHGPDAVSGATVLTLQEALERDLAVVHETGDVNMLAVENRSPDCELFIQSGDIIKGGRQDRMIATDMLVAPGAGRVPVPAHCVEQGRWTNRGAEDAARFHKSDTFAAGKDLKYANQTFQQSAVWQNVSENQGKLRANVAANVTENASPTSFQLTVEAPAVKAKVAEYEAALRAAGERKNVVGVVFVVNGQVTGAEVYGSNALFRKAWPKLLNAAAVEAVAERTDAPAAPAPTPRAIERFLARGADPEPAGAPVEAGGTRRLRDFGGARGNVLGVEEVWQTEGERGLVQTEGRPAGGQVAGRSAATRTGQIVFAGSVNSDAGLTRAIERDNVGQPAVQTTAPAPDRVGRIVIEGRDITGNRVQANPAGAQPQPPAQPAAPVNPNGNRLNSSRAENSSTLMVESRDPARQNAVIHRSYIKK